MSPCRRPLLSTCLSRQSFCWPWAQAIDVKFMPGSIKISGIRKIVVGSLSTRRPLFRSKNQLAKKGLSCVALVVIPVLVPSLDKSRKEDKSLYPVRTLRYYLARTKDLCKGKNLAFVPFQKSFIRILFQLPALPRSKKLCCNATSFLMSKPRACIKSEPMVFKPLLLPKHSQGVSPWTRSSEPVRGRSIILLRNFI